MGGSKWSLILKLCAVASIAIMAIVAFSGGAPTNKEVAASQTITKLVGVTPPRGASRRLGEAKKEEIKKVETENVTKGDGEKEKGKKRDVKTKKKVKQDTPKPTENVTKGDGEKEGLGEAKKEEIKKVETENVTKGD